MDGKLKRLIFAVENKGENYDVHGAVCNALGISFAKSMPFTWRQHNGRVFVHTVCDSVIKEGEAVVSNGCTLRLNSIHVYNDKPAVGQDLLFITKVNPTKTIGKSKKPVGINELPQWLQGKASRGGFAINHFDIEGYGRETIVKGHKVWGAAYYNLKMYVTVKDPDAVIDFMANGIGRSKFYGFGFVLCVV